MRAPEVHVAWATSDGRSGVAGDAGAAFPWWSFSKTVLALCLLRLVEARRLALHRPVPGRPYTPHQLLQHRAGVPDYGPLPAYHAAVAAGEPAWPRAVLLARAQADRLLFAPGTGWRYSNIGYMLVRDLIEAASGHDAATVTAALVTTPLGLRSARLAYDREDFARLHWPAARDYDPGWVYHGCMIGTAADAARLLHKVLSGGLLRPETLAAMCEAHPLGGAVPGRPWTRHGYGLGLMAGEMGAAGRAIGHSGGGPFAVNAVYHFPDLAPAVTAAAFTDGTDEGVAEAEAQRLALDVAARAPP